MVNNGYFRSDNEFDPQTIHPPIYTCYVAGILSHTLIKHHALALSCNLHTCFVTICIACDIITLNNWWLVRSSCSGCNVQLGSLFLNYDTILDPFRMFSFRVTTKIWWDFIMALYSSSTFMKSVKSQSNTQWICEVCMFFDSTLRQNTSEIFKYNLKSIRVVFTSAVEVGGTFLMFPNSTLCVVLFYNSKMFVPPSLNCYHLEEIRFKEGIHSTPSYLWIKVFSCFP